jgi:hypothetical protein
VLQCRVASIPHCSLHPHDHQKLLDHRKANSTPSSSRKLYSLPTTLILQHLRRLSIWSRIPLVFGKILVLRRCRLSATFNYIEPFLSRIFFYGYNRYHSFVKRSDCLAGRDMAGCGTSLKTKLNSVALVRERTIPTERPPPVGEVSANFCV